ncbi:phosphorylase family protein [Dongia rigui]|uniref:Nucleoside phosphorylase domain-containing protein n=1 Tax=Dongia rigui TaxID=940149 RepID=A0ABU5DXG5_9PROT|nr:hypothetical protein [Dongia rigui]MDY0872012.1 hypothetical protein [Dongia rigui]
MLVVIPLEEELLQFQQAFGVLEDMCTSTTVRYRFSTPSEELKCIVILQEEMGKSSAIHAVESFLAEYEVGLIVCLGIAGSVSADLGLGDVCYSGSIIDVYDNNKALDTTHGTIDIEFSPTNYQTPRNLTAAFNMVRTRPALQGSYAEWRKDQKQAFKSICADLALDLDVTDLVQETKALNGIVACGVVSKSSAYNAKLRSVNRKVLAIDTESGGIFHVAGSHEIPAVTIRGISDRADGDKSALEERTKGAVRKIAALNAATFLKLQFLNPQFKNFLADRRSFKGANGQIVSLSLSSDQDEITSLVVRSGQLIDEKLRELCPEIRLQPKGYHLPTPRMRQYDFASGVGEELESDPVDVCDALRDRQVILINIPRTYPDQSIAWVIADDVLATVIEDLQALPIVIDGESLRPPSRGLIELAQRERIDLRPDLSAKIVFIVDNLPFASKSNLAFLIDQIKVFPNSKFVFLSRVDANLVRESEFLDSVPADTFELCKISFEEIANFLEKNFAMSGSEAGVVALRLHETFDQFDLSAHPTYFAGIPRETLAALLQANRRSELIQLAVDGFLSFVVADDPSNINLSRTTRSRFLKKLAVSINVQKMNFGQEELVGYTREFATAFDFNINPLVFISAFVQKGILHFEGDRIAFTLPFIERYLLALSLLDDEALALKYFNFDDPDFDFPTFDIYAEIGASSKIVDKLRQRIAHCANQLRPSQAEKHILLSDSVLPTMMGKPERLHSLQTRLRKAIENVQSNRDDKKEKQRLLDISDKIRRQASKKARSSSGDAKKTRDQEVESLEAAVQIWNLGTVLLGSGAEHLNAETKQELARELIEFATTIMHSWTRLRAATNFAEVKAELTKDSFVREFIDNNGSKQSFEETRTLIASLVDVLEYGYLCEPFRRVVHSLCEGARHKVLATSVEKAKVDSLMERVVHGSWLADIDTRRGLTLLRETVKSLPNLPFLRINLANHLLTRVYWSQWRAEDRLALLDLANETIQPIKVSDDLRAGSLSFNKTKLARIINPGSKKKRKRTRKRKTK